MIRKTAILLSVFASFSVEAANFSCPEKTSEGCASLFAQDMTSIIKKTNTGWPPFVLSTVTSSGSKVTMTYKIIITAKNFAYLLKRQGQTKEEFLSSIRPGFVGYQCDGPMKDLQTRGVEIHNVLTLWDGGELDSFDLAQCP